MRQLKQIVLCRVASLMMRCPSKSDVLLIVLASNDHDWFWFWPLIPLFWLLAFFLFFRVFFWRAGVGPGGPIAHGT